MKKDLENIVNSSVGAIDHCAESFRDTMSKFSPLLGDLAFCVGATYGSVEVYNKRGKHLGEFCPTTGRELKPENSNYNVDP